MEPTDRTVRRYAEVLAVLNDPRYTVPEVPADVPPGGVAWLRAHVARFSTGEPHRARRAATLAELAQLDPAGLRRAAREQASQALGEVKPGEDPLQVAWSVPVALLAAGLGAADPDAVVPAVREVAGSYQPHTAVTPAADAAVTRLVDAFGGAPDERTATRIGLLVQACDATAGLIRQAAATDTGGPAEAVLTETLRHDPPVPGTRRIAPTGGTVVLDFAAANRDSAVFPAPDHFDPGRFDPARFDPDRPDPARFGTGRADAGRAEAGRADPGRVHAGRADSGRADPGWVDSGRADAGRVEAGRVEAGRVDSGRAGAGRAEAGRADPRRADSGRSTVERHLTFGAGAHACPGADLALALAAGVLDAVRALPA